MTSPLVSALIAGYLTEKANPNAYRKCKSPDSLRYALQPSLDAWGHMTLAEFRVGSKKRVRDEVTKWREGGTSFATCRKRCSILRAAFRFAWSEEIIEREHEPVFELPPNGPPRERYLDARIELPALLAEIDKAPWHIRTKSLLQLYTGQRSGAVNALRWEHIDFDNRVIRFRDTEAAEERSKKKRTNIPMDDTLFAILKQAEERRDCEFVISWRCKPVKSCYGGMRALFKRASIENIRTHDLRRTVATYVRNSTENGGLQRAADLLGDTPAITDRHYAQQQAQALLPQIETLSGILAAARSSGALLAASRPDEESEAPCLKASGPAPSP